MDSLKFWENFDLNNVKHIWILVVCMILVIPAYINPFLANNLEVLLMNKKEERKREVAAFVMLYAMVAIANFFFLSNTSLIIVEVFGVIVALVLLVFFKIAGVISRRRKNGNRRSADKWKQRYLYSQMISIILFVPVIMLVIEMRIGINKISLTLFVTVAEILILTFGFEEFSPKVSQIVITSKDDSKKMFVYRKIKEDYLLCGESEKMSEANKIVTIPIKDVLAQKYYLGMGEERKINKEQGESTRDKEGVC